jgi:hypothetical protein
MLSGDGQNGNSKKRKILAVDDDPDITLTVKMGLEASSLFQVDTFNDPELALSSFKYIHFFLFSMDCYNDLKLDEDCTKSYARSHGRPPKLLQTYR